MDVDSILEVGSKRDSMILYSTYFVLLSVFLLNVGSYFDSAFTAIGVGVGMRTVVIQIATLVVVGMIIVKRRADTLVWRELLTIVAVWAPLLFYVTLRVDSDNPYSELKFAKIVTISFLCAVTVTATYLCDARMFLRVLPLVVIVFSVLLGVEALLHPQQFMYRTVIERMTIEGMNPIWLARSFALAGVCLFLLPIKSNIVRGLGLVLVVTGILPTGSRGPLIALCITLAVWLVSSSERVGVRVFISVISAGVLTVSALLFAGDRVETAVNSYFSRGQNQGFVEESGRPMLFMRAIDDFMSSPVVGVGLGEFGQTGMRRSNVHSRNSSNLGYYPHNIIMEILAELGVLGVILATVAMRPGKWLWNMRNPYSYPFLLTFLYSMTSGDINANTGVIIFGTLARLTTQYPLIDEAPIESEVLEVDTTT